MKLSTFKSGFNAALRDSYPNSEINTFFFRLAEFYLGMKRIDVALNKDHILTENEQKTFKIAQNKLKIGEPLQYILGQTEFYGLKFLINPSVLIPRPETEELVEWIINDQKNNDKNEIISILDIGTGSGCIAVTLAKKLHKAKVTAIDISAEALKTASKNAEINTVSINFEQADILKVKELSQNFDIIVSNPPYVREQEKTAMQKNVLDHEPETALFVKDNDALLFYRKISELAFKYLKPGGKLYFEINQYLEEETYDLVKKIGFSEVERRDDLFKNPRMLKGVKSY